MTINETVPGLFFPVLYFKQLFLKGWKIYTFYLIYTEWKFVGL